MLSNKQEMFCHEYLLDFNKTAAAIRAGYSKKTAATIGYENMIKPEIKKRVSELIKETIEDTDRIKYENVNFWREMRDSEEVNENARIKATELLGKSVGQFTDNIDLTGEIKTPSLVPLSAIMGTDEPSAE